MNEKATIRENGKLYFKSKKEVVEHFFERLKERYDLTMTFEEYSYLCNSGNEVRETLFKRQSHISVVQFPFKEKLVGAMFNGDRKLLMTALPPVMFENSFELAKTALRKEEWCLAELVHKLVLQQIEPFKKHKFDEGTSDKDVFAFFSANSGFPQMLMENRKYGAIRNEDVRVASAVVDIINDNHKFLKIGLINKRQKT